MGSTMTLARRLAATGALWIVLVVATAPGAAAGELPGLTPDSDPGSQPPPGCPAPVLLGLPCMTGLPPAPVTDLLLEPAGTELVPTVLTEVEELLSSTDSLPATELAPIDPMHVIELVRSVPAILAQPAGNEDDDAGLPANQPATNSPRPQPAAGPSALHAAGLLIQEDWRSHDASASLNHPAGIATPGPEAMSTAARWPERANAEVDGSRPLLGGDVPAIGPPIVAVSLLLGGGATLAVELARGGGGAVAGVIAFNVWLRRQLRETRMSQRQLAAFSGVDHSTISRLMSGEHEPSLATATKLVEALRKLGGLPHAADYFARLAESDVLPTRRVEAALLGDDELDDLDVRELMQAYLVARARRRRERTAAGNGGAIPSERRRPA